MKMSNRWNRMIYRLWAPIYDALLERIFRKGRTRAMEIGDIRRGERVCLVGIGTGSDLLLLPQGVEATGIDISEPMLARARRKLPLPGRSVSLKVGDAQALPVPGEEYDVVLLNLILSVVPEPGRCMSEALRILRPGGRIVVFDKFLPDNSVPSLGRRMANFFSTLLGTNINRRLGDIVSGVPCAVESDEPSIFGGMYRVVLMRKQFEGR